jgi:Fe-Mn family superoxide dismutase
MTIKHFTYKPRIFDLHGLQGISDQTLEQHFKLYEGYVKQTNVLNEQINDMLKDGRIDQEEMPAYSELNRRLGFEYNGMVLHEFYFENLTRQGSDDPHSDSPFYQAAQNSFGSFDLWKTDFMSVAKMRGVGWAICYRDPVNGKLSNHWVSLHENGNIAGYAPILVLDVWEHAFILDFTASGRGKYIEAFFANVNWKAVEGRLRMIESIYAGSSNP